jgi:Carboxypeptidase regulatory-like domain
MIKRFAFLVLALSLFAVSAVAQTNTGNLTGTVTDPSGIIQGATVVLTDDKTGKEKTVVTNDAGGFSLLQLDVGTYTVKITSPGHKTFTATSVKIDVGSTYTLNATLDVGNISENVTVVAGADIINAADAQLNNTVSQRQILELPLNGRNPLSLVLLQPGTSSNGNQATSINGQRSSFTNITRDGINVQDNFIRSNAVDFIPDRPNVDDTGEFTIVTQNAGAELGYGASQVQLVTPRGSNDFHGAAYWYNRNSHFAANNYFNNFSGVARPFLNRNQFGGKGSGRILKDKLFFFAGFERFILRQSTTVNRTILLPNARNGIFTYRDTTGVTRTVNLLTGPFSSVTGVTAIDPTIQSRIIGNVPTAGNNTTLGDQLNTTGLTFTRATNQDRKAFTSRIDFNLNDKNTFYGIVAYKNENNLRNDVDVQQGGTACCYTATPYGFQPANTPFVAGAWHWQPTVNFHNEINGGWQRSDPTFGSTFAQPAFYLQVPLINNPESGFDAQGRNTDIFSIQDNASLIHGRHTLRFGGQFQRFTIAPFGPGTGGQSFIPTYVIGGGTTPAYSTGNTGSFNTAAGCVAATGVNCASNTQIATANSLVALLGGLVGSANQTFTVASTSGNLQPVPPLRNLIYSAWSGYAADQFRVGPHLTLNLGLRYDFFSPIQEKNGLVLEPVQGTQDIRTTILNPNGTYNFLGVNGRGYNFFQRDLNNFGPVVSFAWSPTFKNEFLNRIAPGEGRSVIRGGYRRSYVNDEFVRAADNALAGNAGLTSQLTASGNFRVSAPPSFTGPAVVVPRTYAQNNALASNFGTVFAIDPNLQVPGTDEFNIGFEREIGWQTALEVRFVHGQSNNLVRGLDLNQVNILNNGFLTDFNRAHFNAITYGTANINCTVGTATPLCQPLQLLNKAPFNNSVFGNPLGFTNTTNPIVQGLAGQLAFVYLSTFGVGNSVLLNNPNTGVVDLLTNSAKYRYNALQVELRRRFSQGLTFQANYTFQRNLTDAPGTGQTNFEPLIDNACQSCEYAIADFDTTHVFNFNTIYELPFGKGKKFLGNAGTWLDRAVGGWQVTSIFRLDSESPFSIADPVGTLNRTGRSGRQTANTNLTPNQVRDLVGTFKTPCGIYYINPSVINLDLAQCQQGLVRPRLAGTTAGVAALGFDQPTFPGQVFFNVAPGQRGNMPVNFLHGPWYFNWDASIIKTIPLAKEGKYKLQLRAEAFNVLNQARFGVASQFNNINSSTFGRANFTYPSPRVIQFVGRFEF